MADSSGTCWEPAGRNDHGKKLWRCLVCGGTPHETRHRERHENTAYHQDRLLVADTTTSRSPPRTASGSLPFGPNTSLVDDAMKHLLQSMIPVDPTGPSETPPSSPGPNPSPPPSPWKGWGLMEATGNTELQPSEREKHLAQLAQVLIDRFDAASINSNTDDEERSQLDDEHEVPEPVVAGESGASSQAERPRKHARLDDDANLSDLWFPWQDKITCTLDILMHLPRSVFSHRQLDLFLWLLKVNDVNDVPSVKSMAKLNSLLQKICGVESIPYKGALGHSYYVNNLGQIIGQEMANPKVRPKLQFYPEDSGRRLSEGRQGRRWLHEIPDDQITPMARLGTQDYYIHEPAMLRDGSCVIPVRWFEKNGALHAKCWRMEVVANDTCTGWRVYQSENYIVPEKEFLKTFTELGHDIGYYPGLPHPSKIIETVDPKTNTSHPWTFTQPNEGNRWRSLAKGSKVVAFPIWLYCDDTSGNLSKKWNEHNSFLFTPAGLPRSESSREYNIHFLSTSNIAPPLEMLDGIVEQLDDTQQNGIWAWDCVDQAPVLVIPSVMALLGDNPMQSEFACHIGLRGKLFCRACWVKGFDALEVDDVRDGPRERRRQGSMAESGESVVSSEEGFAGGHGSDDTGRESAKSDSEGSSVQKKGKGCRKKAIESMSNMLNRIKSFVKIGQLRRKEETTAKLQSYFDQSSTVNTKTKVAKMRTEDGIKDTYQMFFLEKLFSSYKKKRGVQAKQEALDAKVKSLPKNTTSPVWRIKGLDPHQDTPVEVLHVVLLGFVKYLWRDLINQLGTDEDKKNELAIRLTSLDVSGLGISPLAGHTLVRYAGSLVGRDFRALAQVVPFVAYDLVQPECYATWVALSKLVPLIWQPSIEDVEAHLTLLEREIHHFLICTAHWTSRWFNKPKFHIILHLVEHIRRFGPAILFATEAFESFNAVIHAKSVHSNRQAPSRDIALAFAQGNRVRHLLSEGFFTHRDPGQPEDTSTAAAPNQTFSRNAADWLQIGTGVKYLLHRPSTVTQYLGLDRKVQAPAGPCTSDHKPPRPFEKTLTGKVLPRMVSDPSCLCKTNAEVQIANSDKCNLGQFVIIRDINNPTNTFVGCVAEILQFKGSVEELSQQASGVLIQQAIVAEPPNNYQMPRMVLVENWQFVAVKDMLCTVNVQHNCNEHKCSPTGGRAVRQERQITDQTTPVIIHNHPGDIMLNTAQMRDAIYVQPYRLQSPVLNADEVIMDSVRQEIDLQKAAHKANAKSSESHSLSRATPAVGPRRGTQFRAVSQSGLRS